MKTITSSSDISRLFDQGKWVSTPDMSLIILQSEKQHGLEGRVAFIAGKKLGNAVWRNRAKRRMRGLCRQIGAPIPGYDVIFLARKPVTTTDFHKMEQRVVKALGKAGISMGQREADV